MFGDQILIRCKVQQTLLLVLSSLSCINNLYKKGSSKVDLLSALFFFITQITFKFRQAALVYRETTNMSREIPNLLNTCETMTLSWGRAETRWSLSISKHPINNECLWAVNHKPYSMSGVNILFHSQMNALVREVHTLETPLQ